MVFWQVFVLMSVLAIIFLVWPLLIYVFRQSSLSSKAVGSAKASDEVFLDQLYELGRARDDGDVTEDEFTSLKADLERTHHAEAKIKDTQAAVKEPATLRYRGPLIVVALLVPVLAAFGYQNLGAKADWEIYQLVKKPAENSIEKKANNEALIKKLNEQLAKDPENSSNLYLLASTSVSLGDYDQAVTALKALKELEPRSAFVASEFAQALFLQSGNKITPDVRENTALALGMNPNNSTALGLAGIDAYQKSNYQEAIQSWTLAVQQLDPNSSASKALVLGIARARAAASTSSKKPSKAKAPAPAVAASAPHVDVKVSLDLGAVTLDGTETVFVYARAWKGTKMPLAIKRMDAKLLPTDIRLDTSSAMAPGVDITSVPELEIVARVSKSGKAVPESGDWIATYGPVTLKNQTSPVELKISKKIP